MAQAAGSGAAAGGAPGADAGRAALLDRLGRPLRSLRISVTDRCNLRCAYCMPEEAYTWLPREELLTFEEVARLVSVFTSLGVDRVRLTGGEPLLRQDLPELVRLLRRDARLTEVALTTNGVLLEEQLPGLLEAGLSRVTVSLDTLRPERFHALTRRNVHGRVLEGIAAVARAGLPGLKLDCVVVRGTNDDELDALLAFGQQVRAEVRFIEYMDVGGATRWAPGAVVSRAEMLERIGAHSGPITPVPTQSSAPAERFVLPDGTTFGIIASTTAPFCARCDRARLTADGTLFLCLYARQGVPLREALRSGAGPDVLARLVSSAWHRRDARGAEERLALIERQPLARREELREDPRLEMHTRGG
ncbi:MAG: GTP 3',8-cyclase MoaA [Myxococcaceae bacterium]|nr:GTP 3',8-cyclase MoaA [Myxococcaceae bacterium]